MNWQCQLIDMNDVFACLVGSEDKPQTEGAEFDMGGPEIIMHR
ncbi:MAG: hypothetical protein ABSG91_07845 [Syntrophobacteraceae bacterium]